ncbi:universal stress protein [Solwaraspora sp. WMMD406]|uniref:universal stress protein n=1 Tax=Solwaraspora sp. WMMD406 TaxID=3016095 RepID=UPI002417FAF7|nr:universal stress protein [Solwaraspora sp. WMMD406]MDG4766842.1 universal stress protein [Solwaraspora sp. WMMD406]
MNANHLIVVGIDGSDGARRALDWAAQEAATRGGTLRVVTAWRWDSGTVVSPVEERQRANKLLDQELAASTARHGAALPVVGEVHEGRAADVLTLAARSADLLVLGSHGHSRLHHTVLGSVSEECIRKATCPVVVIPVPAPATPAPAGAVAVG